MILAAGVGSRLRPLTDKTPKALLKFEGKTMLEHVINQLSNYGISEIIINLHHHADMVEDYVVEKKNFGLKIAFSNERDGLMDTGGGIVKARWFLDDAPFIIHNVDVRTDLNLADLYQAHMKKRPLATLAVSDRETSRNLLIDAGGQLCGWRDNRTGEEIITRMKVGMKGVAFSAVHVMDPMIFDLLDRDKPFSMTDAYLALAAENEIMTFDHSGGVWTDMAKPGNFNL